MKEAKYVWLVGLLATLVIIGLPLVLVLTESNTAVAQDNPWENVPVRRPPVDHTSLITQTFTTGPEVTRDCLRCHDSAGEEMLHTAHFQWQGEPTMVEGHDEPVSIGKKNTLNNFCLGIQSNWPSCTSCHAGYGWEDANFDFTNQENIDCLVCHDQSGGYVKGKAGLPVEGVDLLAAAQSVSYSTRQNCGSCHFNGGGGNAVKHGDMDQTLYFPTQDIDVHMGRYDFQCTDCHQTDDHQISGRAISVSVDDTNQVACTDCHSEQVHEDERLNAHTDSVACQTCHIPEGATREATKMHWDWSTAGRDDIEEDPHEYLKIKGSFVYAENFTPEYAWHNGFVDRYLFNDPINPDGPTQLNAPLGNINDPDSRIWPFKIHRANQPYDTVYNYLLQPKTAGPGGFWTEFDWIQALELGTEAAGQEFSGEYGFAPTEMHWTLSHMVVPKEQALQCTHCHSENGRMDWQALGYPGDPMRWGSR
jgi:octaheme c-type cytochrome (tetrathionate reductase family)